MTTATRDVSLQDAIDAELGPLLKAYLDLPEKAGDKRLDLLKQFRLIDQDFDPEQYRYSCERAAAAPKEAAALGKATRAKAKNEALVAKLEKELEDAKRIIGQKIQSAKGEQYDLKRDITKAQEAQAIIEALSGGVTNAGETYHRAIMRTWAKKKGIIR